MTSNMTSAEWAELAARRAASAKVTKLAPGQFTPGQFIDIAESSVQRRLIAAALPGGLAEYWALVEQEIRK